MYNVLVQCIYLYMYSHNDCHATLCSLVIHTIIVIVCVYSVYMYYSLLLSYIYI